MGSNDAAFWTIDLKHRDDDRTFWIEREAVPESALRTVTECDEIASQDDISGGIRT